MKTNDLSLIVLMQFGSYLYGTTTSESDKDYKGIFMPSREEILLGRIPKCHNFTTGDGLSKNTKNDVDTEIYSLHYFIKLASEGQTVALDMLHAPEQMLLKTSYLWNELAANKDKFYTNNLKTFINYARRQASKYGIKGSRLNDVLTVLDLLKREDSDTKLKRIWKKLPRTEHCLDVDRNPNGLRQYQVCGKIFQETTSVSYVIPILEKYYDDYGHRAKLAAENKNIDWKAISHALRAAYQTKEIFLDRTIRFPLKEADFLTKVKLGKLDYLSEVAPVLESLMAEVELISLKSDFPEKVDLDFWDDFLCKAVEASLRRNNEG